MQLAIVIAAIAAAVAYAARRLYLTVKRACDPCQGCDGCALKDVKMRGRHKGRTCGQPPTP